MNQAFVCSVEGMAHSGAQSVLTDQFSVEAVVLMHTS